MSRTDCWIALSSLLLGAALLTVGAQPAAGQPLMVDIGSRKLYASCSGPLHSPVVILEAGSEAASESWSRVQPQIAMFYRVCSYDRAGLGKSPSAGHEESVSENVADLHSLLQSANIKAPYVLVAHSSGGLRARQFQSRFPAEVIGMVLVDSAHEEQIWRFNDAIPGATRGIPGDRDGLARMGLLPPREILQWHVTIPLIVIEHGKPGQLPPEAQAQAELAEKTMHALQVDLASRSSRGELRKADQSGHDIPNEQPDAIVRAVRDVVARALSDAK